MNSIERQMIMVEFEGMVRRVVREEVSAAFSVFKSQDLLTLADIAKNLGKTPRTIRARLRELTYIKSAEITARMFK